MCSVMSWEPVRAFGRKVISLGGTGRGLDALLYNSWLAQRGFRHKFIKYLITGVIIFGNATNYRYFAVVDLGVLPFIPALS